MASKLKYILGSFLFVALFALVGSAAAEPTNLSFVSSGDSYVDSSRATQNKGSAGFLRVDGSPEVLSYVKFDVQGVTGQVSSATLRIFSNSGGQGFDVHTALGPWDEGTITYGNQPGYSAQVVGTSGPVGKKAWSDVDVTSAVTGNGEVSFVLTTGSSTNMSLGSRESSNPPELLVTYDIVTTPTPTATPSATPTPTPTPTPSGYVFEISGGGSNYSATSLFGGNNYQGSLKSVVESAFSDLDALGGGTVSFQAGVFDLGTDYFLIHDKTNIVFAGQGIDVTTIQNNTDAAADTEPFNFSRSNQITIRDMTVVAGGAARTTSDAIDFDQGNNNIVERVKIAAARGRGIVFDGKDAGATADGNTVRDCEITGTIQDGIELLASSNNTIQNCYIHDTGGHGIQINKASGSAAQPNKPSDNNFLTGNTIDNAGQDGINVHGSNSNTILGNTITNSSDDTAGRSGIRIMSTSGVACNDNRVDTNIATDNQATKTQKYGLYISSLECTATVVTNNDFSGNLTSGINDQGTGTIYF